MSKSHLHDKGERVQLNCPALPEEHGRIGTIYQTARRQDRLVVVEWDDGPIEKVAIKLLDALEAEDADEERGC